MKTSKYNEPRGTKLFCMTIRYVDKNGDRKIHKQHALTEMTLKANDDLTLEDIVHSKKTEEDRSYLESTLVLANTFIVSKRKSINTHK